MDIHWSHRSSKVIEFLERNNIVPLFIPARCTDAMQVCDTVLNRPFKNALKEAFKLYLYKLHDAHVAAYPDPENCPPFTPNLNPGWLKDEMTQFVLHAMNALKTAEMKEVIVLAFKR